MKLLAKRFYGYQNIDRIRHAMTWYLNDEKTHAAINSKSIKKLNHLKNAIFGVELVKAEIENTEPIIKGFFVL